jgi:SAM-dependent methyltransferase
MSRKRGKAARNRSRHLPVRTVPREDWGVALEVGGVTQSVSVPDDGADAAPPEDPRPGPRGGYWGLLLPLDCPRRALLLGLGGGTVARLLARRCPGVRIVGVERDAEVLAVARADFALDEIPGLEVAQADAFAWAEQHAGSEPGSFDYICLDLFQGGRLALGALATPFLRQLAALLAPGGVLTVNLMVTQRTPDQIHRLERDFTIQRQSRLRGNLVLHAALPPPSDPHDRGSAR